MFTGFVILAWLDHEFIGEFGEKTRNEVEFVTFSQQILQVPLHESKTQT